MQDLLAAGWSYPDQSPSYTLLAAIGDVAHPLWRASAVGVYRLWRDGGYAAGALVAGALADLLGIQWAIGGVAALTFASGVVAAMAMYETRGANRIVLASPGTLVEGKEVPA